MNIDEARRCVGQKVIYTPQSGEIEEGVVSSVSNSFVFVRYGDDYGAKATDPALLTALAGDPS